MNIYKKPSFFRDLKTISDPALKERVGNVILAVENAQSLKDIPKLKKMKGHRNSYRIKVGDYRIGVNIENNIVEFVAFGHRKDIYNFFRINVKT